MQEAIKKYHLHKEKPFARQFEIYDLQEYTARNIPHSTQPHAHSFYQIIWFFKGEGKHFVDFTAYDIPENSFFFIAKNQVHAFENREDYEGVLIHFNEVFLYKEESDIDLFLNYSLFNSLESPFIQLDKNEVEEMNLFIRLLQQEINNREKFGHQSILSNVLKALLIRIEREKRLQGKALHNSWNNKNTFLKFRKYLEYQYKNNKPVKDYASELNMTSKALNKLVKLSTGKTTTQLIQNRIILEAKRQLMHSDLLINEIAFDLGFEDASYFLKFFKKHVHCTPSQFRAEKINPPDSKP